MRHKSRIGSRHAGLAAFGVFVTLGLSGGPAFAQINGVKMDRAAITGPGRAWVAIAIAPKANAGAPGTPTPGAGNTSTDPDGIFGAIGVGGGDCGADCVGSAPDFDASMDVDSAFAGVTEAAPQSPSAACLPITLRATEGSGKTSVASTSVTFPGGKPTISMCLPHGKTSKIPVIVAEVTKPKTVQVVAAWGAPTTPTKSSGLGILPVAFNLTCNAQPTRVGGTGKATVTLTAKSATAKTVTLMTIPVGFVKMPATVTIKPGDLSADFSYTVTKFPPVQPMINGLPAKGWASVPPPPKECKFNAIP